MKHDDIDPCTKTGTGLELGEFEGQSYVYTELKPNTIRIFELFPASVGAPISGSLRHMSLDAENEQYEALSYAWGDSALRETISCDGSSLRITENLHRTLSRLRRSDASIFLWVDAICIDQGTDKVALQERAQQVTMMHHIFAKASRVIVDLGETTEDFNHLLAMLEKYTLIDEDPGTHVLEGQITLPGSEIQDMEDVQLWRQLFLLLRLPWFRRLWCFQEFILAQKIATLVGSRLVAHFDLHLGITRALFRFSLAYIEVDAVLLDNVSQEDSWGSFGLIHRKQALRDNQLTGEKLFLEAIWIGSRYLEVTDLRDKIYAIYALLPTKITTDFHATYHETVEALQQRISHHLVVRNLGVWVLMYAVGPDTQLPSWTMSLSMEKKQYWRREHIAICAGSMREFVPPDDKQYFCAGGSLSVKIEADSNQLKVEGCIFDHIVSLSQYVPPLQAEDPNELTAHMFDRLVEFWHWAEENDVSEDILWKVLVFDCYGDTRYDSRYQETSQRDRVFEESYQNLKNLVRAVIAENDNIEVFTTGKLFLQLYVAIMVNMRLAITARGIVAAVPYVTRVGDKISIFSGVTAPFVLREMKPNYQLVGVCYLHGFMDGQALTHEDWKPELITII